MKVFHMVQDQTSPSPIPRHSVDGKWTNQSVNHPVQIRKKIKSMTNIDLMRKSLFYGFSLFVLLLLGSFNAKSQSMGIDYVDDQTGIVWFDATNLSANWSYVCLDGCFTGTKNGDRIEREFSGLTLGETYAISAQIQDNTQGQVLPEGSIAFENEGNSDDEGDGDGDDDDTPQPTCSDGIKNGDETGIDCGGACTDCPTNTTSKVEAESGTILGDASVYDDGAASGGQGVAYLDEEGNGFRLSNTPAAESIEIVYASENTGTISIVVNGNDAGNIDFTSNGAWVGSYNTVSFDVNIPANSTVDIYNQSGDVALNVDYMNFIGEPTEPTCSDNIQNGDETGVDCGGSCDPCPNTEPVVNVSTASGEELLVGGAGSSAEGLTLYTWDEDGDDGISDCYDDCEEAWPPLLVNSLAEAIIPTLTGFDASFGVSGRCDGTLQLTYDDKPLYFFTEDESEGETKGDGANGTWHVIEGSSPAPTCDDGIKNGDETGVDCGGSSCRECNPCDDSDDDDGEIVGDDFVMGLNSNGIAYHEGVSHSPSFFVISLDGNGPEGGVTTGASGRREADFSDFVQEGQTYTMEVRIQGDNYNSGQCIHSIQVKMGEGVDSTPCQTGGDTGGGSQPDLPDPVLAVGSNSSLGAFLTGSTGSAQPGFSLYTTSGTCTGGCLDNWPAVLVDDPAVINDPGGITNTIGSVEFGQVDCQTKWQVTLDGQPLYFYAGDDAPGDTNGDNLGPWSIASVERLPKLSDQEHMKPALKTPINGRTPGPYGWVHDINGRDIQVRAGESVIFQWAASHFVGGVGLVYDGPGDHDWTFVCSCNQKEFYEAEMKDVSKGVMEVQVPGNCFDKYYYYFRYKKAGLPSDDLGTQIVYSGLFEYDERNPNDRIDPAQQPQITSNSANWMRFRHPRAHDGNTELIFNSQNNSSQLRDLDRYTTTVTTGGNGTTINADLPNILRIEAFDNGLIKNANPAYAYNKNTCCGQEVDYGNVITYEITIGSGAKISSQIYNTFQHIVVGKGFESSIPDPRLNLAGRAATTMEFSTAGSHVDLEQDAIFTQHVTTVTSTEDVDDFLEGHHIFHGLTDQHEALNTRPIFGSDLIGEESCQNCHFRDGRGSELVETPKGPRIAPPVFGTGILTYIEGAEAGLTWSGDVPTVREQVRSALVNDHKVDPDAALSTKDMTRLVRYVELLTVPNRNAAAYLDPAISKGHMAFLEAGCTGCHQETQVTSSSAPVEFRNLVIRPFTDMKIHAINGGNYRTAPLWGLGRNIDLLKRNNKDLLFMHNGSATTLDGAIQDHDADAAASRSAYNGFDAEKKANLIKFLETL